MIDKEATVSSACSVFKVLFSTMKEMPENIAPNNAKINH